MVKKKQASPAKGPQREAEAEKVSGDGEQSSAGRRLMMLCLFYIMLPPAVLTYAWTKRVWASVGMAIASFSFAFVQAIYAILYYRVYYSDAPAPISPSHGVVVVHPDNKGVQASDDRNNNVVTITGSNENSSNGEKGTSGETDSDSDAKADSAKQSLESTVGCPCHVSVSPREMDDADARLLRQVSEHSTPLRVLLLGDSLAVGVGQTTSCTPLAPEAMAKTISKQLGGRPVFWTCHGAVGASTGWIVHQLERGIDLSRQSTYSEEDEDMEDDKHESMPASMDAQSSMSASDTDESSVDDSETEGSVSSQISSKPIKKINQDTKKWRERLAQHRKRFDPELFGPYDVIVVVSGANDLKSALFPFLFSAENTESVLDATGRDGSYSNELRHLLELLNKRMQKGLSSLRESVEMATESVRETMEGTWEYIIPSNSTLLNRKPNRVVLRRSEDSLEAEVSPSKNDHKQMPLVVLPGMPSDTLPVFDTYPLRWVALPLLEIMDNMKAKLAKSHPGEVRYMAAPAISEYNLYAEETGPMWEQRQNERTLLSLRDVRSRDCKRIEGQMKQYAEKHAGQKYHRFWDRFFAAKPHTKCISVDSIHPNDLGYDFFGRMMGNFIVDELKRAGRCNSSASQ
jgi:hypothetical protein